MSNIQISEHKKREFCFTIVRSHCKNRILFLTALYKFISSNSYAYFTIIVNTLSTSCE